MDNYIVYFITLKQLGPKRHVLDFDETGIGFPHLEHPKTTSISKLTLDRESKWSFVKTRGVRTIREYNSVGDSVMS